MKSVHEKNLTCHICGNTYGWQETLDVHVKSVHSSERPITCEKCKATFKTNKRLDMHTWRAHKASRPFECSTCFQTFNSKERLDNHVARVHELRHCESCPYCEKQFSKLKVHISICRANPQCEKTIFECPNMCGFTSRSKEYFSKHCRHCKKQCKVDEEKKF